MMETLEIKRGNPLTAICTLTYTFNDEPIPLDGCTILFTAKELTDNTLTDDTAVIKSNLVISEAENGLAILMLTDEDTAIARGLYKCDIRVYDEGEVKENTDVFYAEVKNIITSRTS